jgi:hypothetical protein
MCLQALITWICVPEDDRSSEDIERFLERERLSKWLTKPERKMMLRPRALANRVHVSLIGWKMENLWPVAWVLGFERKPDVDGSMVGPEIMRPLLFHFLPRMEENGSAWVKSRTARSRAEVVEREDLFYCAHNAARSAQLGEDTVPRGFDPVSNGGVIHERRHALSWCLSPGTSWEKVPLDT